MEVIHKKAKQIQLHNIWVKVANSACTKSFQATTHLIERSIKQSAKKDKLSSSKMRVIRNRWKQFHHKMKPQPLFPRGTRLYHVVRGVSGELTVWDVNYAVKDNKNFRGCYDIDKTKFVYKLSDGSSWDETKIIEGTAGGRIRIVESKAVSTKSTRAIDVFLHPTCNQLSDEFLPNYTRSTLSERDGVEDGFKERFNDEAFQKRNGRLLDAIHSKMFQSKKYGTPPRLLWCDEEILGRRDCGYNFHAMVLMIKSAGVSDTSVFNSSKHLLTCDYAKTDKSGKPTGI